MIKKFDEFIAEAKLEYNRNDEFEDMSSYVHDPDVFVYANRHLLRFCQTMCSQINKYAKLNLYVNGQFGKIDGEKVVMLMDRDSDKCVCILPYHGRTVYASLYYFSDLENNNGVADFYMSSENIGIVNLIKMFCDMISDSANIEAVEHIDEAYDINQRKLIVTPKSESYAKAILAIKPGVVSGRNKTWKAEWTQELIDMIQNGTNIFDIAMSVETQKENSPYWKYFGEQSRMGKDNRDTLLVYLARQAGISMSSDKVVAVSESVFSDEDEWYQRVAKMDTETAKDIEHKYDVAVRNLEEAIQDFADFYHAKGKDKLEVLKYTKQMIIVPGKGGIGKTTLTEKLLQKNGLRKNIDYVCLSSASSDAESIYNFCYDYNGKIIVFDDIPEMFGNSSQRISLWKNLISGNLGSYGHAAVAARQTSTRYYQPLKYGDDNRARYYAEAGDGATMGAAKAKALNNALKSKNPAEREKAEREQEELSRSSENFVKPSEFTFTGAIIALTNASQAQMKKDIGAPASWQAIKTRALMIELNPPGWVLWLKDKNTILAQKEDTSIPDDCTLIPRELVDEYIAFVEQTISDGKHDNFNYRISGYVGARMRKGREWQSIVLENSSSEENDFE